MSAAPPYRDEEEEIDRFDTVDEAIQYIADQLEDVTKGDVEDCLETVLYGEDTRDAPGEMAADTGDRSDRATLFSDGWTAGGGGA